ncbi:hypothetical protein IAR55_003177 [Kwoniella newhampshirensis]|uniref:Uncharacterized protein n=1 Tax=Kwoniella newhampshirensis TaxID=1651941 RepID=A0AAW0YTE5_9TREE
MSSSDNKTSSYPTAPDDASSVAPSTAQPSIWDQDDHVEHQGGQPAGGNTHATGTVGGRSFRFAPGTRLGDPRNDQPHDLWSRQNATSVEVAGRRRQQPRTDPWRERRSEMGGPSSGRSAQESVDPQTSGQSSINTTGIVAEDGPASTYYANKERRDGGTGVGRHGTERKQPTKGDK